MGQADHLVPGDWNAICYQCGRKMKASTLEKNWQGYYVCPEHNEPRHPQDFVRAVPDGQNAPWTQPPPADHRTIVYTSVVIGVGDGVTTTFQFGSGLGPIYTVYDLSTVYVGPFIIFNGRFSINDYGVITLFVAPASGELVTATGSETQ